MAGLVSAVDGGPLSVLGWDAKYDLKGCCDDKTQELDGCKIQEVSLWSVCYVLHDALLFRL